MWLQCETSEINCFPLLPKLRDAFRAESVVACLPCDRGSRSTPADDGLRVSRRYKEREVEEERTHASFITSPSASYGVGISLIPGRAVGCRR